ncbi:putative deferrochelatase/peroxidase EfeN precursor [Nocardioides dokdonensis FR1436]|uniref:Putative deferrochelatase/peroxidase EfeN n=1 Tax=Nocardioides dokdonensis FR1436 TaxID=1300347 RepID=A0A1A9GP77_9ACTN|nr:Dyp-type peroxidase [Nocardioides dokdonensis]ANH40109.1 putative deferrochelatase/peroxidase EfeN precursor [Nocardioides dokdonensis FR1436]
MTGTPHVSRRRLLGYVGTTGAGAVAGAGLGAGVVLAADAGNDPPAASAPPAPGRTIEPWGAHQAGVATAPTEVTELVALDLLPDVDRESLGRLMRLWTGDVEALTAGRGAPGDPAPWLSQPAADLTITVGAGPGACRPGLLGPGPTGFAAIPVMRRDRLQDRWSGGDLLVVVAGRDGTTVAHAVRRMVADARPFARLRWRQVGSWSPTDPAGRPQTGRNHFGQVDGSGNPRPGTPLFDSTVWVREGPWAGGSTLAVRRIRMDLDTWEELTRDEQERSVGRRLGDGAPLTGGMEIDDLDLAARAQGRLVVPRDAHSRRAHPSLNGGRRMFRKGVNYTREVETRDGVRVESGLVFLAYQADLLDQFVPVQRSLDEADRLNEWTTTVGSAAFAVLPGFEQGSWLGEQLLG